MAEKTKDASKDETKEASKTPENPLLAPKRNAEDAATKDHKSFRETLSSKVLLIGLSIIGVIALFYAGYTFLTSSSEVSDATPGTFPFAQMLLFGLIVLLVGMLMPGIKKFPWVKSVVLIIGTLIISLAVLNSGFGKKAQELLTRAEACVGYDDCGERADSFPTIENGSVELRRGESKTFYAIGRVRLNNHENYCLNISPPGVFDISWTGDARVYYIASYSGKKELVTVTSKPAHECRPV